MAKDVTRIEDDIYTVQELWKRRQAIKAQISQLQAEDDGIVQILVSKIGLNTQSDAVQHFEAGELKFKATPKIYRKVDTERVKALMAEDPEARLFADIFKEKYELSIAKWKKLSTDQQAIFVDCITETPGKPQFEEEKA